MDGDVLQVIAVASIPVVVLALGGRPVRDADLRRWSDRFGCAVLPSLEAAVRRSIARGRRYRSIGAAVGLVVAGGPAYMNLIDAERSASLAGPANGLAWVYGAAVGAAIAEASVVQRPLVGGIALVERRTWRSYVSSRLVTAAVAVALLSVAVTAAGAPDDRVQATAASVAAIVSCGCLVVGLRRLVDRPRLAPDAHLTAVDDAMRADGAHHLAGAVVAASVASAAVVVLEALPSAGWWALAAYVMLLVQYASLRVWWGLAHTSTWRATPQPVAA